MSKCKKCQKEIISTNKKKEFCSISCKSSFHQRNSYAAQKNRARSRKAIYVQQKGGCCQICGYSKCQAALSFHHRDPSKKSFALDARNISNRKIPKLLEELEKCDLLCLNCHAELHFGFE